MTTKKLEEGGGKRPPLSPDEIARFRRECASWRDGFDYVATLLKLREFLTYDLIAELVGYESRASISEILSGKKEPTHRRGEAIYILYVEVFRTKPPLKVR